MLWVLGLGVLVGLLGLGLRIDRFGRVDHARPATAVVVLGARVRDGRPSAALRARVEKGVALHRAGMAPLLVFSGGGGRPSEAWVSKQLATQMGVHESACLLEEESGNTAQNARFTRALLRERGLGEVVLVSDAFHLYRACLYFRGEGITVHPSPASLEGRRFGFRERLFWTAREVWALALHPWLLAQ